MPFALDQEGRPILLISTTATHTQNLKDDSRGSLFIGQLTPTAIPLSTARVTLVGHTILLPESEVPAITRAIPCAALKQQILGRFADFRFFRLQPVDLY